MTWRSTLGILVTVLALATCYWIGSRNRDLLSEPLTFWTPPAATEAFTMPVGQGLLVAFALGAALVAVAWTVRGTRQAATRSDERRARRREEELDRLYRTGLEEALRGRGQAAVERFRSVLEQQPGHVGALAAAADALRELGRPGEALELRQRLLASAPADPEILVALAEDHRARGDLALAVGALEDALEHRPDEPAELALRLRELCLEKGDWDRALGAHDRWLKLAKGKTDEGGQSAELVRAAIQTRAAARAAQEGRGREALASLRRLVKRHPDFVPASLALARALILDGKEEDALQVWLDGYERTRDGSFLMAAEEHFLQEPAESEDAIERTASALAAFRRFAAGGEALRPQAMAFLGKLQTRLEMLDEAAASFDSVRDSFPDNPTFTYYAARIAEKRDHPEVAAPWYRGILKSLDILRPLYRCRDCEAEHEGYEDRCGSCGRWGTISLDIGLRPLSQPLPSGQPVYVVESSSEPAASELGAAEGETGV